MPTIRQKIVDAIEARFATILTSNGYQTSLGQNVWTWRPDSFSASELPAVNIRDVRCETERMMADRHHHKLTVECDILVANEDATGDTIRLLIADVIKCIGVDRYWTADSVRLAFDTDIISDEIAIEQEGDTIGGARVTFVVQFRTKPYDPFIQ